MRFPLAITIIALTLPLACNDLQLNGSGKKGENGGSKQASTNVETEAEKIDPPSNVSGSYLHCAVEQEPTDAKAEALLGCRFDDLTGKRVPVNQISSESLFSYRLANVANLKVYLKDLPNDNRYDAVFLFLANSKADVLQGMAETRIFVQMKDKSGADAAVSGLVSDIQIDPNAIPEARETDYAQVREEIIAEVGTSEPLPLEVTVSPTPTNVGTTGESYFGRGTRLTDGTLVMSYGQDINNNHTLKTEVSKDDGKTWQVLGEIVSMPFVSGVAESVGDPSIAVLPSGTLLAVYRNVLADGSYRLQASASTDGGKTWAFRGDIEVTAEIAARSLMPNLLLNSKGQVQVYYMKSKTASGGEGQVVMRTSSDEGRTWVNQTVVAVRTNGNAAFPAPVRLNDGSILVAFDTSRADGDSHAVVRYVQSNNDGLTWSSHKDLYIPANATKGAQSPQITMLDDGRPVVLFMTDEDIAAGQICCSSKLMIAKNVASFDRVEWDAQAITAIPIESAFPAPVKGNDGSFHLIYEKARNETNNVRRVQTLRVTIKGGL